MISPLNRKNQASMRSGIALIMAMAVLVLLMLMGLPFLLSQSAGISGIKSYQEQSEAEARRQSVEALGITIGSEMMAPVLIEAPGLLSDTSTLANDLVSDANAWLDSINSETAWSYSPRVAGDSANPGGQQDRSVLLINTEKIIEDAWGESSTMRHHLTIQDESGKININMLFNINSVESLLDLLDVVDRDDGSDFSDTRFSTYDAALVETFNRFDVDHFNADTPTAWPEDPANDPDATPRPDAHMERPHSHIDGSRNQFGPAA